MANKHRRELNDIEIILLLLYESPFLKNDILKGNKYYGRQISLFWRIISTIIFIIIGFMYVWLVPTSFGFDYRGLIFISNIMLLLINFSPLIQMFSLAFRGKFLFIISNAPRWELFLTGIVSFFIVLLLSLLLKYAIIIIFDFISVFLW